MYLLGLQPQQPLADGADHLHRLRRRRCDRHDREHRPLHRGGRAPAARRRSKGSAQIGFTILSLTVSLIAVLIPLLFMGDIVGRLFREFAITLARGHPGLGRGVADADAHAVRQAAEARAPDREAGRVRRASQARLRPASSPSTRARCAGCSPISPRRSLVAVGTLVLTLLLYVVDAQGLLPDPGHGRDPRHLGGARRTISFAGHGRAPAGARRRSSCSDPGGRQRCRRSSAIDGTNVDAQQRPHPDHPEAARASGEASASAIIRPPAARAGRGRAASRSTCSRCRTSRSRTASAAPSTSTAWRTRRDELRRVGAAPGRAPARAARAARRRERPAGPGAARRPSSSTATPPRASGITPQMIDDTLYNAFGQRQISTIFTQLNQYRVVLEVQARVPARTRTRSTASTCARPAGGGRCRSRPFTAIEERADAPLAGEPPGPVPGGDRLLQPGARRRRSATRWTPSSASRASSACPRASQAELPGHGARLPGLAGQRAAPDPGRARHRLHRAGRALRELHPPDHDPVHAALGGGGRARWR